MHLTGTAGFEKTDILRQGTCLYLPEDTAYSVLVKDKNLI
jgi:hypothetical protein